MPEPQDKSDDRYDDKPQEQANKGLVAAVFCAVIGLMVYAGFAF